MPRAWPLALGKGPSYAQPWIRRAEIPIASREIMATITLPTTLLILIAALPPSGKTAGANRSAQRGTR